MKLLLVLSVLVLTLLVTTSTAQGTMASPHLWVRHWLLTHHHKCLVGIIDLENRTYDPTLNYGGGHGNVYVAYGIPQADPGTKMRSAGRDWRTNPMTQVRWMIRYTRSRFGSECNAYYHRVHYHMY